MVDILEKYIPLSNKSRNLKLYIKKFKCSHDSKRREEVTVTRAKICHSYITHAYIIRKEPEPVPILYYCNVIF